MAYTFQSRATADLIMLKAAAEQILKLLDKPVNEAGILTVEQIPAALETLDQAVKADEARRQAIKDEMEGAGSGSKEQELAAAQESAQLGAVTLRQRVVPFADMLRRSAAEGKPVTWVAPK